MQLWASCLLRFFGVREHHITDIVLQVLARVSAEWSSFEAPRALPARTARRRWIAELLVQRAASRRRADFLSPPRETADQDSDLSPTPEPLAPAREMLRWLEQATTPERWRLWLAREVDDLPLEASSRLGTFARRPASPPSA